MSLTELERYEPGTNTVQGRELTVTFTGSKDDGAGNTIDSLAAALLGTFVAGESNKFGRVCQAYRIIRNDPEYPGNGRVIATYSTQTPEQYLYNNPGKAFVYRDGSSRQERIHVYPGTNNVVEGFDGTTKNRHWVVIEGEPIMHRNMILARVHGYVTAPATIDAYLPYVWCRSNGAMSNLPAVMSASGDAVLTSCRCSPVPANSSLWSFDCIFAYNNFPRTLTSKAYKAVIDPDDPSLRPFTTWVADGGAANRTCSLQGTGDFSGINAMIQTW